MPPLPRTPPPVSDLEVTLAGDVLELAWSAMPPPETGPVRVEFHAAWESAAREASSETEQEDLEQFLGRASRVEGPAFEWGAQARRRRHRMSWALDTGGLAAGEDIRVVLLTRSGRREVVSNEVRLRAPEVPPPPVSSLEVVPEPDGVRLRWGAFESAGRLELYRQEEGDAEVLLLARIDPAVGEFEDRSVRLGETYRYSARLRQKMSERSWVAGVPVPSDPITYRDIFPPAPPQGLTLVIEGEGARLLWSPNREPDLAGYRIYRRSQRGTDREVATLRPWDVTWLDPQPSEGTSVEYWLTAFDSSPQENESQPSDSVSGVVRRPRALPAVKPEAPHAQEGQP